MNIILNVRFFIFGVVINFKDCFNIEFIDFIIFFFVGQEIRVQVIKICNKIIIIQYMEISF